MCDRLCLPMSDLTYNADSQTWKGGLEVDVCAKELLRTFEYHFKNQETTELMCFRNICVEERSYHLAKLCKLNS